METQYGLMQVLGSLVALLWLVVSSCLSFPSPSEWPLGNDVRRDNAQGSGPDSHSISHVPFPRDLSTMRPAMVRLAIRWHSLQLLGLKKARTRSPLNRGFARHQFMARVHTSQFPQLFRAAPAAFPLSAMVAVNSQGPSARHAPSVVEIVLMTTEFQTFSRLVPRSCKEAWLQVRV
jgi:hypothetical protein